MNKLYWSILSITHINIYVLLLSKVMYRNRLGVNEPNHSQVIHPSHLSQSLNSTIIVYLGLTYAPYRNTNPNSYLLLLQLRWPPPKGDPPMTTQDFSFPKNCFGVKKKHLVEDDLRAVRWIQLYILAETSSHRGEWAMNELSLAKVRISTY